MGCRRGVEDIVVVAVVLIIYHERRLAVRWEHPAYIRYSFHKEKDLNLLQWLGLDLVVTA